MEIKVIRESNDIATPGQFSVDGAQLCYSLEPKTPKTDADRIAGKCCVPVGKYIVKPRFEGEVFEWMKKLVPDVAKWGIPHIMNIPGVDYPYWCENSEKSDPYGISADRFVLLHIGNSIDDTLGCCLLGLERVGQNKLQRSTDAFNRVFAQIKQPMRDGTLTIEYVEK